MVSNKIKCFLIALLITIVIVLPCSIFFLHKTDISQATYSEIYQLEEFGEVLSNKVILFLEKNPHANVDDLILIDGIGEERLKILKKYYK